MLKFRSILRTQSKFRQLRYESSKAAGEGGKLTPKPTEENATASLRVGAMHKPNKIDKWLLVWDKKYKSFDDVPMYVTNDKMEKARNWARIKISTYLMIGTVIGCIIMIISGKRAAARGESVAKANLEWHKKNREEMLAAQSNQQK
ncbi:UPF0389 protein GA21628 [Ischnura elegans]|uniref:UPF0389 protein GA21628 n=1 Tax=Ischnura elegans TaxID=197161 RepID=UPI001ED8B326|nr:UPF0389 protein GA21628 [Ischnura elegans]XP_046392905.1 UPF0389 protein GA21628 [Ischnura elegans]XP_046392906.1 UPF0389 protein GA21628 [Ischnura elegans]XP_046392907.1 UPF0389 protein GA21628 [Ischnura elegans]XP_046392908.1 UPF0389 protein GA21628 [Ischnura elegans]XP_046392910.1 UPF0389 protein GA21628 [Ischnura elegans]XP_046392911.1 UPF0389 protein GA21628 [Ischnura elegans]